MLIKSLKEKKILKLSNLLIGSLYRKKMIVTNLLHPSINTTIQLKSFLNLLEEHYFNYFNPEYSMKSFLRSKILFVMGSLVYLDSSYKYITIRPIPNFLNLNIDTTFKKLLFKNEGLLTSNSSFRSFKESALLQFPLIYLASVNVLRHDFLNYFLQLLHFTIYTQKSLKNFAYKIFNFNFSKIQKKLNFLQFNIFLKNINIFNKRT